MKTNAYLVPKLQGEVIETVYDHDDDTLTFDRGIDVIELDKKQVKELIEFLNELNLA